MAGETPSPMLELAHDTHPDDAFIMGYVLAMRKNRYWGDLTISFQDGEAIVVFMTSTHKNKMLDKGRSAGV